MEIDDNFSEQECDKKNIKAKEYRKKWRENPENREYMKKYLDEWRKNSKEKINENRKKYYAKNKEKIDAYTKEWRKKNPDKIKAYALKNKKKKESPEVPQQPQNITLQNNSPYQ